MHTLLEKRHGDLSRGRCFQASRIKLLGVASTRAVTRPFHTSSTVRGVQTRKVLLCVRCEDQDRLQPPEDA